MTAARSGGVWGSALTSEEFAAIRGAGFEPVGQVFGAAVHAAGSAGGYGCPGAWASGGAGPQAQAPAQAPAGARAPASVTFGPLVRAVYRARHAAVARMAGECARLGGDGVVGVRLSRGALPFGGLAFTAIGTAVRAPGSTERARGTTRAHREPFTCCVSGQDFAKLIMAGWVPAGLVLGISIGSRHDDRTTTRQAWRVSGNAEITGWTDLVSQARHDARRALEGDVRRLGAEGVVVATMGMEVRERDCPAAVGRRDHIVEATIIGTAIAGFPRAGRRPAGPALAVMSLDPQRRQAARARHT